MGWQSILLGRAGATALGACLFCAAAAPAQANAGADDCCAARVQVVQTVPAAEAKDGGDELKERLKALEERERALYAMSLDGQRNAVNWWLSFLAFALTLMAMVVPVAVWLVTRRANAELDRKANERQAEMQRQGEALLRELQGHVATGAQAASQAQRDAEAAAEMRRLLAEYRSGPAAQAEGAERQATQTAATVLGDRQSSEADKLRAKAVIASERERPSPGEARQAYELWQAVEMLEDGDAAVHFNAGYWAQYLYELGGSSAPHWFAELRRHYERALALDAQMADVANNLAIAIEAEAQSRAKAEDWAGADALWRQADARYQQALQSQPDSVLATNNWASGLLARARLYRSRGRADEAGAATTQALTMLEAHVARYPQDAGSLALNLACSYAQRGRVADVLAQLDLALRSDDAPGRAQIEADPDLALVSGSEAFGEWLAQRFGAAAPPVDASLAAAGPNGSAPGPAAG